MKQILLDAIADRMNCPCLSDLKTLAHTEAMRNCINGIPTGAFSLRDWNDSLSYLLSAKVECQSEAEARATLNAAIKE